MATRIRARREELRLTQRELARRAGCDFVTMWRYERGLTTPSAGRLLRIAQALGVSMEWLCSGA